MLPEDLQKPSSRKLDVKRVSRVVRLQGLLNILLIFALAGSWIWFYHINPTIYAHALSEDFDPPLRIDMALQAHNGERYVLTNDVVQNPIVTIYGQIDNFDGLNEALPDFGVKVRGNFINPKSPTGEFVEKLLLNEGKNNIEITIEWGDEVHYRYRYNITFIKPVTQPVESATNTNVENEI